MATGPDRPAFRPATVLRAAGIVDIALGGAIALFGNRVLPLGDIAPGIPVLTLAGGLFALFGIGTLFVAAYVDRRRESSMPASRNE